MPFRTDKALAKYKRRPHDLDHEGFEARAETCRTCERREIDWGGCRCQALALTGDAAATDPVCHLSPHHDIVVDAVAAAEQKDVRDVPLVYRDQKNSERLLARL